jgi:hypothetical protein
LTVRAVDDFVWSNTFHALVDHARHAVPRRLQLPASVRDTAPRYFADSHIADRTKRRHVIHDLWPTLTKRRHFDDIVDVLTAGNVAAAGIEASRRCRRKPNEGTQRKKTLFTSSARGSPGGPR